MAINSVLIVGAGPAGLSLGQYLKTHNVPYKIVEKSSEARLQGYSVSVHFAIEYLTLAMGEDRMKGFEEKTSVNYTKETGFGTVDSDGSLVFRTHGTPTLIGYGIRANRSRLRQFLMSDLQIETGVDVSGVEFTDNGAIVKSNKDDMTADVIVGADGLYSCVRKSVVGDKVEELSIVSLSASREITAEQHAQFIKYSPTHAMMYGRKVPGEIGVPNLFYGVNDMSEDRKTVNVRWILSWDKELIYQNIPDTDDGLRKLALEMSERFADPFKSLVQGTDPNEKIWLGKTCQYLPDPSWDGKGQVTLIGDALHAMTPYRGEGLNHAIVDIVRLGEQLIKAHQGEITVPEAIAAYEEEAVARGKRAVLSSNKMAFDLHRGFPWIFTQVARLINFALQYTDNVPFMAYIFPKTH
jgi:2-polyprenyl-6-methoxyphenol hydroxylase-like FAD-dependent oxidoreductase